MDEESLSHEKEVICPSSSTYSVAELGSGSTSPAHSYDFPLPSTVTKSLPVALGILIPSLNHAPGTTKEVSTRLICPSQSFSVLAALTRSLHCSPFWPPLPPVCFYLCSPCHILPCLALWTKWLVLSPWL